VPDLAIPSVLDGALREIERTGLRARNGIKYVRGGEWAPLGPTPSDVVWARGKTRLRRYRRDTPARMQPPVLAFLGLVGRAYVFDLWKGNSIVQLLLDAGFDVFVLDWGEPDHEDAANTLETYLQDHLPQAIAAVCSEAEAQEVSVIGYCMGGAFAVHALAAQPELPVRNLVTIATPFDFAHLGPVIDALRDGRIACRSMLDEYGNVPGSLVRQSFKSRKPTGDLVRYANLWQNLWNDEYMEGYQAIGRWLHDHVPVPGAVFEQVVEQWIRDNGFVTDRLRLGRRRVRLEQIQVPTLAVLAERDDICPEPSTAAIAEILTGGSVDLMRLDAGHASITSGRRAVKVTLPEIFGWLARHSEETA